MFRVTRAILVLPLLLALGGCETSSLWDSANNVQDKVQDALADFNPFGTAKKPLPGERRAVFPEGVPGVQQGVPQDLYRGNQQAIETPSPAAAPAPAPEPKAAKGKSTKSKVAKKTQRQQQPAEEQEPAAAETPDEVWPPPPQQSGTGLRR
jgi:hypothetical protein